jgi:hypothetical protein
MQRIAVTLWRRADQQEQVIARRSEINPGERHVPKRIVCEMVGRTECYSNKKGFG